MLHSNRMRFSGIRTDKKHRLRIVHVIVGVGHCTIAPGVSNPCDRSGVTDSRLVIDIVSAPQRREFSEQVRLFVVEFRRTQPVNRIRAGLFPNAQHLVTDVGNGFIPANLLPFTTRQFHRVLNAPFTMPVFTYRGAFRAVTAKV